MLPHEHFTPEELQAQRAATRARILDAARHSFLTQGYRATKIAALMDSVELATGTFYLHFTNKREILDQLWSDFADQIIDLLAQCWVKVQDGQAPGFLENEHEMREFLRLVAQRYLAFMQKNEALVRLFNTEIGELAPAEVHARSKDERILVYLKEVLDFASGSVQGVLSFEPKKTDIAPEELAMLAEMLIVTWLRVGSLFVLQKRLKKTEATRALERATLGLLREYGVVH